MILPPPGLGFEWVSAAQGPALVCRPLERAARHLFTDRRWRLGSAEGMNTEAGWREVADAMDVPADHLVRVRQVHGADVAVHRASRAVAPGAAADIIAGDDGAAALVIQTADCVPMLMADARTGAVSAAHAGWKGTALRVAAAAVAAMADAFGSRPADLIVAVGPSIGPCCYQIGADVRDRFAAERFSADELSAWFTTANGPLVLDLWTATRDQLAAAGIPRDHIFLSELCTMTHREVFPSYRRDGNGAGRLAAAIRPRSG